MTTTEIRALEAEIHAEHFECPYDRDCDSAYPNGRPPEGEGRHCDSCGPPWPCHAIRAADALALLVAVAEAGNGDHRIEHEAWGHYDHRRWCKLCMALAALAEAKL